MTRLKTNRFDVTNTMHQQPSPVKSRLAFGVVGHAARVAGYNGSHRSSTRTNTFVERRGVIRSGGGDWRETEERTRLKLCWVSDPFTEKQNPAGRIQFVYFLGCGSEEEPRPGNWKDAECFHPSVVTVRTTCFNRGKRAWRGACVHFTEEEWQS